MAAPEINTAALCGLGCARSASVTINIQRDCLLQLQVLLQSCTAQLPLVTTQGGDAPRLAEVIAGVKDVFDALEAPIERLISCLKFALDSDFTFVGKRIEFEQTAAGSLPTCLTLIRYRRPIAGTGSHFFFYHNDEAARQQQVLDSDGSFASKVMSLSGRTGYQVLDALLAVQLPATAATTADAFMRILVALASVCVLQEHLLKRCLHLLADSSHPPAPESGQGSGMDESCSHLLERACTLANHIATHMDVAAAALCKFSGLPTNDDPPSNPQRK